MVRTLPRSPRSAAVAAEQADAGNRLIPSLMLCVVVAGSLPPQAMANPATDRAVADCRAQTDAARRLACYDAIPLAAGAVAAKGGPRPDATSPAGAVPAAAAAALQAPEDAAAQRFGLTGRGEAAQQLDTRIDGIVEGWGPRSQFRLANGQVWEVEDSSTAALYLRNPKVTVRRGFAGAYYLELEGTNRSPRVRRVR